MCFFDRIRRCSLNLYISSEPDKTAIHPVYNRLLSHPLGHGQEISSIRQQQNYILCCRNRRLILAGIAIERLRKLKRHCSPQAKTVAVTAGNIRLINTLLFRRRQADPVFQPFLQEVHKTSHFG
jgi:hypothetical protein